MVLLLKFEV